MMEMKMYRMDHVLQRLATSIGRAKIHQIVDLVFTEEL